LQQQHSQTNLLIYKMKIINYSVLAILLLCLAFTCRAQTKHSENTLYPTYKGLIMAGYQGWFSAAGDGSNSSHYVYGDEERSGIDLWPDVSEYEKTYPTPFKLSNGQPALFFSSADKSTVDLHFKWMQQYRVDGVFMQRFFGVAKSNDKKKQQVFLHYAKCAGGCFKI